MPVLLCFCNFSASKFLINRPIKIMEEFMKDL